MATVKIRVKWEGVSEGKNLKYLFKDHIKYRFAIYIINISA